MKDCFGLVGTIKVTTGGNAGSNGMPLPPECVEVETTNGITFAWNTAMCVDAAEFRVGQKVTIKQVSVAEGKRLAESHGGWNPDMASCLGLDGKVTEYDGRVVRVHTSNGEQFAWNPVMVVPKAQDPPPSSAPSAPAGPARDGEGGAAEGDAGAGGNDGGDDPNGDDEDAALAADGPYTPRGAVHVQTQRDCLRALNDVLRMYIAAAKTLWGSDCCETEPLRATTAGCIFAVFDAVLRLQALPAPLPLSVLMAGRAGLKEVPEPRPGARRGQPPPPEFVHFSTSLKDFRRSTTFQEAIKGSVLAAHASLLTTRCRLLEYMDWLEMDKRIDDDPQVNWEQTNLKLFEWECEDHGVERYNFEMRRPGGIAPAHLQTCLHDSPHRTLFPIAHCPLPRPPPCLSLK